MECSNKNPNRKRELEEALKMDETYFLLHSKSEGSKLFEDVIAGRAVALHYFRPMKKASTPSISLTAKICAPATFATQLCNVNSSSLCVNVV